ncbi:23S ribosomal RNA methyltransferase [Pilatotrama ljubarskyi]|nr:23S ribosomal RNA methyltransferase [Pilatotrama ljubarskyi]
MPFRPTLPALSKKVAPSARAWLARQFRDPYVKARLSFPLAYRSRSAFKLLELDQTFHFLDAPHVRTVVDLGAAPGGWSQVVSGKLGWVDWQPIGKGKGAPGAGPLEPSSGFGLKDKSKANQEKKGAGWSTDELQDEEEAYDLAALDAPERGPPRVGRGTIIAVDLLRMDPIPGVKTVQMDFLSPEAEETITELLRNAPGGDGKADVILSDMAANFTGNPTADNASSLQISRSVFEFAKRHLRTWESIGRKKGGVLVLKHFVHPQSGKFRKECLDPHFRLVKYMKPPSSRSESAEAYWLCMGFKGVPEPEPEVELSEQSEPSS